MATKSGKDLIQLVNELQDKLNGLGVESLAIDLPQIAVIGGQSAGKSSVLESFVGRDFLPRGSGIVTRRPLVLQLIHNKHNTESYGEFLHVPNKRYANFAEIRDEIVAETDREVRDSTGISAKPINLRVTSPDVLDLTLVDLPGMTRVPVGSQPRDIESLIETMLLEYIRRDNCLILAVTAATQDLATSDALKLAERVDPRGERTIGILTKLDRVDEGQDVRDILTGAHGIRLTRGFIGVVNRSQRDIDSRKDMKQALADERRYFSEHKAYADLADRQGIGYLQQYLHRELSRHIYKLLPPLKQRFELELSDIGARLELIREPLAEGDKELILAKTNKELERLFDGAVGGLGSDVDVQRLSGGARINAIMNDKFGADVGLMYTDECEIRRQIVVAIQNINGVYIGIFPPDAAFKACVLHQIELFRRPSMACVEAVTSELHDIVRDCVDTMDTYTPIKEFYTKLSQQFVDECKKRCKHCVEHLIRVEKAYLNTNNEDFIKLYIESIGQITVAEPTTGAAAAQVPVPITEGTSGGAGGIAGGSVGSGSDHPSNYKGDSLPFTMLPEDELVSSTCTESTVGAASVDGQTIPAHMRVHVEQIKRLIDAYVVLLKKKFRDHLPKLCTLELIHATKEFIGTALRVRIRDHIHTIDDISGGEDPDKELRLDLLNKQQHYSDAIEILRSYRDDWTV